LAWSSHGGSCIFIESTTADQQVVTNKTIADEKDSSSNGTSINKEKTNTPFHGRGDLFCTGQLGAVMKESSSIAYTVAKRHLSIIQPDSHFFQKHRIHLHLPAGAIPKDGPSAGITMVCSLLSLALHTPMRQSLAMTGELTLTGKVLPIGGVKDKLMAAKHAQVSVSLSNLLCLVSMISRSRPFLCSQSPLVS
jgi:ATP-dependent Lon protease